MKFKVGDLVIYKGNEKYGIGYGAPDTPLGISLVIAVNNERKEEQLITLKQVGPNNVWYSHVFKLAENVTKLELAIHGIEDENGHK